MSSSDRQANLHGISWARFRLRIRDATGAMARSYRLVIPVLVLLTIVIVMHANRAPAIPEGSTARGAFLPDMRLQGLDGDARNFADYRGRLAVINVWATWCAPCRAELPSLQRLREQLDPDRFVVLGISIDADRDFVGEFLRDLNIGYVNFLDPERRITEQVLGVRRYPQTLIVGPDGKLLRRVVGGREWDRPEIVANIREFYR